MVQVIVMKMKYRQFKDDPKRLAALFLMKTCKEHRLIQAALNGIVQDLQGIWKDAMERLIYMYLYKCYTLRELCCV